MAWSLVIWVSEGWKYSFFVLAESMSSYLSSLKIVP
jgi:hypothetical protein